MSYHGEGPDHSRPESLTDEERSTGNLLPSEKELDCFPKNLNKREIERERHGPAPRNRGLVKNRSPSPFIYLLGTVASAR